MRTRISRSAISIITLINLGMTVLANAAEENAAGPRPAARTPLQYSPAYRQFAGQKGHTRWAGNGLDMKFVWCPAGSFVMGTIQTVDGKLVNENQAIEDQERLLRLRDQKAGNVEPRAVLEDDEIGDNSNVPEAPAKKRETRAFLFHGVWLGQYEVTRKEWTQIMGTEPWQGRMVIVQGDDYPATYISWNGAVEFCRKFTDQERAAGRLPQGWEFKLPTDAQWERACRAGTTTRYSFGGDAARLGDYAWIASNTAAKNEPYPHRVGQKQPNPWGFYDMHGNVVEWCQDAFDIPPPGGLEPLVTEGTHRVQRGGHWRSADQMCRSSARYREPPELKKLEFGFRVALSFVK